MRGRAIPAITLAAVGAIGLWLRVVHLGTPSLWWDELVHLRTADRPFADVLRRVRHGATLGAGNAGAMPGDYVLLHAFLRVAPTPAPERVEVRVRTPSAIYSTAAIVAMFVVARPLFGVAAALLASGLLAVSLPAILYAAEARHYSLFVLVTIVALAAFDRLARAPTRPASWIIWTLAGLASLATGIFAVFPLATQFLVLLSMTPRRRIARPSWLALLLSAATLAAGLALLLDRTAFVAKYPRHAIVTPAAMTWEALVFLAGGHWWLVAVFALCVPFALVAARRRGGGPAGAAIVASFLALPAIALVIAWKHYYFHGRHVLFLLPCFHLVVAGGLTELVRRLDPLRWSGLGVRVRRDAVLAAAGVAIAVPLLSELERFVANPRPFFARSKTLRDHREVVQYLAGRVASLAPGTPYLVLAERNSPANAVLSAYLGWYGLHDRIVLRSPGVPLERIAPLLAERQGDPGALALRPAVGLFVGIRELLGVAPEIGTVPARIGPHAVVAYATPQPGPAVRRWFGVTLREGAVPSPSPPRS